MIFSTYSIFATCTSRSCTIGTGTWRTVEIAVDVLAAAVAPHQHV